MVGFYADRSELFYKTTNELVQCRIAVVVYNNSELSTLDPTFKARSRHNRKLDGVGPVDNRPSNN